MMGARLGVWHLRGSLCLGGWAQTPARKLLGCDVSVHGLPSLILSPLCSGHLCPVSAQEKGDVIMGTPLPSPSSDVHEGRVSLLSSALLCKCLVSSRGAGVLYQPGAECDV